MNTHIIREAKIDHLPEAINWFKDSLKHVIITESLSEGNVGSSYMLIKQEYNWRIYLNQLPSILIPFNASLETPPSIRFKRMNVERKQYDEFFKKIEDCGLMQIGFPSRFSDEWSFIFIKEDSLINFYSLCVEHDLFNQK